MNELNSNEILAVLPNTKIQDAVQKFRQSLNLLIEKYKTLSNSYSSVLDELNSSKSFNSETDSDYFQMKDEIDGLLLKVSTLESERDELLESNIQFSEIIEKNKISDEEIEKKDFEINSLKIDLNEQIVMNSNLSNEVESLTGQITEIREELNIYKENAQENGNLLKEIEELKINNSELNTELISKTGLIAQFFTFRNFKIQFIF